MKNKILISLIYVAIIVIIISIGSVEYFPIQSMIAAALSCGYLLILSKANVKENDWYEIEKRLG